MKTRTILIVLYVLILTASLVWLLAILAAPWFNDRLPLFSRFVYLVFSPTCHQISSRCFYLNGHPLAVCSRCFGIYSGFLIGTLSYPWIRGFSRTRLPKNGIFFFFTLPIALDTAANFLGLWSTAGGIRFALGGFWGVLLPFYVITAAADLAIHRKRLK